jgi:NADH:ubiquinone oxidoreductase subunit 6 (subunit J)
VSLSRAGAVVSVLSCAVMMLRSRHHRLRAEVLVGLASGALVVTGLVLLVATVVRQGVRSLGASR